mgnify:CR=1 FL=1
MERDGKPVRASCQRVRFRIGVNLGDVLIEGDDILGDGVNVAARLEAIAEPGGICVLTGASRPRRIRRSSVRCRRARPYSKCARSSAARAPGETRPSSFAIRRREASTLRA